MHTAPLRSLAAGLAFACLALVALAGLDNKQPAADWPVFRGNPLQTGVATSSLPDRLAILWQVKTRDGVESTAAIVDDTVFVGSLGGTLHALELATGKEKWVYKAGPIKAPVSVRDGLVYVGDEDGLFHCVAAATGQKRWAFETGGEISSGANFVGDLVLFGSGDEHLYCLTKDGKERWKFRVPGGPVMATPAVVQNRTFVAGCDSALHVIDVENGKELAQVDLGGQVGATAAVAGEQLYVGTMSSEVFALNWTKPDVAWKFEAQERKQPFYSSPAVTEKLVVVGSRDKRVYGLDRKTGKEAWSFATRGRVDSSPVVVGNRVLVGSMDKHLYVLDLAQGTEVQRVQLADAVVASPAVAGGRVVIGAGDGTVYCLGAK